jgi:hypothetical protein
MSHQTNPSTLVERCRALKSQQDHARLFTRGLGEAYLVIQNRWDNAQIHVDRITDQLDDELEKLGAMTRLAGMTPPSEFESHPAFLSGYEHPFLP